MAISDKLTYLNTTKTLIKDNLNLGGANISNEPFRVYSSKLIDIYKDFLANGTDTLWNNWNKVNGTGESLTLNNTIKGKMKIDLKGNTSQDTTTGKNLFDVDSITANTYLLTTGVTGTSSVSNLSDYISVKANQQYYLSYTYSSLADSSYRSLCYYNTSKEYVSGLSIDPTTFHTFTPAQDGYIRFSYDKNYTKIQLEKGNQASAYEIFTNGASPNPDYPQDIHTVSGDNSIKVGQNIWNYNGTNYEQGFYDGNGGFISRSDYRCFTYDCKQGDLFERTGAGFAGVVTFWNNSTFISSQNFDLVTPKGIVQVPQNANKIKIAGTNASSSGWIRQNPINYQVNLGEYELCKIGDYQDSIVKDNGKWYLNKQIGKVVLDGTEAGWTRGDTTDSYSYFYTNGLDSLIGTSYNALCNVFNVLPSSMNASTSVSTDTISIGGTAWAKTRIKILTSRLSENSVNGFKTWLSTHNTEVYYILATPTYTEITDSTLISQLEAIKYSYNNQTNISQTNTDKPFILDVTALGELEI
jgi:hypothetical protein